MKLFSLPPSQRVNNPYLRIINDLLSSYSDIDVDQSFDGYPGLLFIIRHRRSIYHFHWLTYHYYSPSRIRTFIRFVKFIVKLLAIKISGSKIVWTLHNYMPHDSRYPRIDYSVRSMMARLANIVICHSEEGKVFLKKQFRRVADVRLIPHPHYIDCYKNNIKRSDARRYLNISEEALVFLSLGTIRPYRNLLYLINTFRQLDNPMAILLIAGAVYDPILKEELIARSKDDGRIRLYLLEIADDDMQIYFNAADVSVFTFQHVLTSGSVILSLSFKTPVIVPSYSEALSQAGSFCVVYDDTQSQSLLSAMQSYKDKDFHILGQKGYDYIQQFSPSGYAEKLVALYRSLFGR